MACSFVVYIDESGDEGFAFGSGGSEWFRPEPLVLRNEQIHIYSAGRRMGLQIADAIASGFFKAVEPSPYGHTEDRYARMLKPVVYRQDSAYLGSGLSFWPEETESLLRDDSRFDWVRGFFGETG